MTRASSHLLGTFLLLAGTQGTALAATDVFLKIGGVEGEVVAKTSPAADGSFAFNNVADGKYVLEVVIDGKVYSTGADGGAPLSVTTARAGASGLATGKRQHEPVTITKKWDAASPQLVATVNGASITGKVGGKPSYDIKTLQK